MYLDFERFILLGKANNQSYRKVVARAKLRFLFCSRSYTPLAAAAPTPPPPTEKTTAVWIICFINFVLFSLSNAVRFSVGRDVTRNSLNAVLAMTRQLSVCASESFLNPSSGTAFYFIFIFFIRSLFDAAFGYFSILARRPFPHSEFFGFSGDGFVDVTQRGAFLLTIGDSRFRDRIFFPIRQSSAFCGFVVTDTSLEFHNLVKL